jgi:hypothetical protein
MDLNSQERATHAERLIEVCAQMEAFGRAPWSLPRELLEEWLALFHERSWLQALLTDDFAMVYPRDDQRRFRPATRRPTLLDCRAFLSPSSFFLDKLGSATFR